MVTSKTKLLISVRLVLLKLKDMILNHIHVNQIWFWTPPGGLSHPLLKIFNKFRSEIETKLNTNKSELDDLLGTNDMKDVPIWSKERLHIFHDYDKIVTTL